MFARINVGVTNKEKLKNIEDLVNPRLLKNKRVTMKKWTRDNFERGLKEGEAPFPAVARSAPYTVSHSPSHPSD